MSEKNEPKQNSSVLYKKEDCIRFQRSLGQWCNNSRKHTRLIVSNFKLLTSKFKENKSLYQHLEINDFPKVHFSIVYLLKKCNLLSPVITNRATYIHLLKNKCSLSQKKQSRGEVATMLVGTAASASSTRPQVPPVSPLCHASMAFIDGTSPGITARQEAFSTRFHVTLQDSLNLGGNLLQE